MEHHELAHSLYICSKVTNIVSNVSWNEKNFIHLIIKIDIDFTLSAIVYTA